MAGRDKTGPLGMGSRTGRGFGLCNLEEDVKNKETLMYGMGRRLGRGRGSGWMRGNKVGYGKGFGFGAKLISEEDGEE